MPEYVIPCDTFVRLSKLTLRQPYKDEHSDWFNSIRIDQNCAVVSNAMCIAVERIKGGPGILHIPIDPVLLAQCELERPLSSDLVITYDPAMAWASAKTSMGWIYPGNASYKCAASNELDKWRDVVPRTLPTQSKGGMLWTADLIAELGSTSPSGAIVFSEYIDVRFPTILRDVKDNSWFAIFKPCGQDANSYSPATLPEWFR